LYWRRKSWQCYTASTAIRERHRTLQLCGLCGDEKRSGNTVQRTPLSVEVTRQASAVHADRSGKDGAALQPNTGHALRPRKLKYAEARKELLAIAMQDHYSRPIGLKALGENTLARDLWALGARCGVEVTARILRHTFATHVLDNGADIRALKEFLGHRLLRSTTVYSQISQIPIKRAYDTYHPEPA
jgi:integrase